MAAKFPPRVVTVRGSDRCFVGGAYVYLGPTGSAAAREAYDALVARLAAERAGRAPPPRAAGELLVRDLVARFLAYAERTYSARGREVKQFRRAFLVLLAAHGRTAARAFGPKALRDVQAAMKRPPYDWCRNVVNRQVVRLRTMWRWCEAEELAPAGSTAALLTVPGLRKNDQTVRHTKKRAPTSWEDLQKVLPFCPAPVRTMLELQWWAGMRSQDVRLMRAELIDASGGTWLYAPEADKGDWREGSDESPRVVFLGPECQALLTSWVDAYPESLAGYLFAPVRHRRRQGSYTAFSFAQAVRRASRRAGVKVVPYGSRHAAKDRITRAEGIDAARVVLGQKSLQSTAHYGSLDREHGADVARRLS